VVCGVHRLCDWFKIDLPEYLFPATSDVDASIIDTDVIREVCEVSRLTVLNAVLSSVTTGDVEQSSDVTSECRT